MPSLVIAAWRLIFASIILIPYALVHAPARNQQPF